MPHTVNIFRHAGVLMWLAWLLLAVTLLLGAVWQWYGRSYQHLDVGGSLDTGYLLSFYAPEQSPDGTGMTYRWSQPSSEIRLWGPTPGTPVVLTVQMLAAPQPDGPQRVSLYSTGQYLAHVALTASPRFYHVLTIAPEPHGEGDIAIGLEATRLAIGTDPRSLGVAVDSVALNTLHGPTADALLRELWSVPFLPLGLLLFAACAALLRLPSLWIAGLPALALATLALLARLLPDARMILASYLVAIAVVAAVALALAALLRRMPKLWPDNDQRARGWISAIFIGALVTTFAPTIQSDGTGYYAYLRSLTMDGDLQFGNEYREAPFRHGPDPNKRRDTATGHQANHYSVGPAIAWSPLYGVAHLIVLGGQSLGVPWDADGYADPYVILSMFTSALAGFVTLLVTYQIVRRWVDPPVALLAVVTLFLGSILFFYAMREGSFAHSISAMVTSLYVLAWLRLEERPGIARWAVLGATAGASILIYWLSVLVLVLPVFTFARLLLAALRGPVEQRGRKLGQLVLGAAVAAALLLLVFSPQLITWKILYGSFLTIPQGTDYVQPRVFRGMEFLFSRVHGMLPWSPAFFFGMLGLPLLWRRNRWLSVALVTAFALYFWYNASHWQWHAGGGFGPRRMVVLTPWYAIGLALLFDALRRWRAQAYTIRPYAWSGVPVVLAMLMIAWMTLLTMRYRLFLIPHDPGQIGKLPDLSFYFGLEALPLWALPGWANNSFIVSQIRAPGASAVLIIVMVLATWGVLSVYRRLIESSGEAMRR